MEKLEQIMEENVGEKNEKIKKIELKFEEYMKIESDYININSKYSELLQKLETLSDENKLLQDLINEKTKENQNLFTNELKKNNLEDKNILNELNEKLNNLK
jgi:DNA repair exonuclease SbcCD ATPase subunit